jgi:membrane associated rhomboid family serine protease
MIPLCDSIPSRTRPGVVFGIGALHILAFVLPVDWSRVGPAGGFLVFPNWYALVTCLAALWLFGPTVEDRTGHPRFVVLWLAGGAAAFAAYSVISSSLWLSLASTGAVSSVIAAHLALYPRGRLLTAIPVVLGFEFTDLPSWLYACAWVLIMLIATPAVPVESLAAALLAGGGTGVIAAVALRRPERMKVEWWGN